MQSGNARACTSVVMVCSAVVAFVFVVVSFARFYSDYSVELEMHDNEAARLRTSWLYECADERERLPREIQMTCKIWKEKLQRYTRVGVKNVALASALDAWFAAYTDGIGTELMRMGYNLFWMAMMLSICVGFLLFCAAFFVTRIASVLSQSSYALPLTGTAAYHPQRPYLRGPGSCHSPARVQLVEDSAALPARQEPRKTR